MQFSGKKVQETLDYINGCINRPTCLPESQIGRQACQNGSTGRFTPQIGIILGTGLGGLINPAQPDNDLSVSSSDPAAAEEDIQINYTLNYTDIPHFPLSTVESHQGCLLFGKISNHNCVIMQGRFHYYEGYKLSEVTYPILIMQGLGIKTLLVSNACGAVNPIYCPGDLMLMRDHINYLFDTPMISIKLSSSNKKIYDPELIELAEKIALENNINVRKGVYCALRGPTLETKSEYRMVRKMGADVVGMSTIPEALLSRTNGMKVFGISVVTDVGFPDTLKPASLEAILKTAAMAEPNLVKLMKKLIEKL